MKMIQNLTWNFVTKNLAVDEKLQQRLRVKIAKLEKHLQHFPKDTVHLQIVLERHKRKPPFRAALILRVPSNILRSEKSAATIHEALNEAVKTLGRELQSLKAQLRRERFWNRQQRRERAEESRAATFTTHPAKAGTGPQNLAAMVSDLLQQHHGRLLQHARRHLRHDEWTGAIPPRSIDAREIVDAVAQTAVERASRIPPTASWLVWFYRLLHEELRRQRQSLKRSQAEEVSIEDDEFLPDDAQTAEGCDVERPLDILAEKLQPAVAERRDLMPDPHATSPDELVAERDLLAYLQSEVQKWPRPEQEVFELHFVQGFEPDEIAQIVQQPARQVQTTKAHVRERMRDLLLQESAL